MRVAKKACPGCHAGFTRRSARIRTCCPSWCAACSENGANTSFVNRIADDAAPIEDVIRNPIELLESVPYEPHPGLPLPSRMFAPERVNSAGIDLSDCASAAPLCAAIE